MRIPGELIALATFPGVAIHEMAHQLFCRLFRVAIFDVCYFQCENPVGYVRHEVPRKTCHHAFIALGPFLVNSLLGAVIGFPAALAVTEFGDLAPGCWLDYLLVWLGVSIAMHAFPSLADAASIWDATQASRVSCIRRLMWKPLASFAYAMAFIGFNPWFRLAYGAALVRLAPGLLVRAFA